MKKMDKVEKSTLFDDIIKQIQKRIQNGELKPGDQFPSERELARQFNVSRNTLREVLKALKLIGVIESKQGNGTFVNENLNTNLISTPFEFLAITETKEIFDLLDAREAIEITAVSKAAKRATQKDIEIIKEKLTLMEENIDNVELCSRYDAEFHFSICNASKNKFLIDLLKAIQSPLLRAMNKTYNYKEILAKAIYFHEEILDALLKKDSEKAAKAMNEHLMEIRSDIKKSTKNEFEN